TSGSIFSSAAWSPLLQSMSGCVMPGCGFVSFAIVLPPSGLVIVNIISGISLYVNLCRSRCAGYSYLSDKTGKTDFFIFAEGIACGILRYQVERIVEENRRREHIMQRQGICTIILFLLVLNAVTPLTMAQMKSKVRSPFPPTPPPPPVIRNQQ